MRAFTGWASTLRATPAAQVTSTATSLRCRPRALSRVGKSAVAPCARLPAAFLECRLVGAARNQTDSCNIKNRFRNSVQSQVLLDQRVPQCSRAEGSKSQPRCREAKRLTEMARLEQNNPIRSSSTVLPHRSREDHCHDEKRCCLRKIRLIRAIRTCHARSRSAREPCQAVVPGLVVIDSPLEPLHPERHQIYLSRVPGTAGRAGLVR